MKVDVRSIPPRSLGERLTTALGFARGVMIDTATNAALLGEMTL